MKAHAKIGNFMIDFMIVTTKYPQMIAEAFTPMGEGSHVLASPSLSYMVT
jgi:hypothetical protein